jgi:hypothetical protein
MAPNHNLGRSLLSSTTTIWLKILQLQKLNVIARYYVRSLGCVVCLGMLGFFTPLLHSHVVRLFGVSDVFEW